jgi:Uma2 family endonuclease
MITSIPKRVCWTKHEYYKMAEMGLFDGKHVELIEGDVIEMSPMRPPHRTAVVLTGDRLRGVFGAGYFISVQSPFDAGEPSEPEPDIAVIPGNVRDYKVAHPTTAVLIVEVADTSLQYDRIVKASLYAKAGIKEYWIVNLVDNQVEVYRHPVPMLEQTYGFGYTTVTILKTSDTITPLAAPHMTIAVAELLP